MSCDRFYKTCRCGQTVHMNFICSNCGGNPWNLNEKRVILIEQDIHLSMARVSLDGKVIMEGNYWDFKPLTHGINQFGEFKSFTDLGRAIYQTLIRSGNKFENIKTVGKYYEYKEKS